MDRVRIKVCGLTNDRDYRMACELGADWAGFLFHPGSPRFIRPESAGRVIARGGPGFATLKVGVFVNESIPRVREIFERTGLDIVQLHGDEDPAYCRALGLPYWKAVRIKDASSLEEMTRYGSSTFLLDAHAAQFYGGTGRSIDLSVLRTALGAGRRIIVAGGVSAATVPRLLALRPYGLDACSSLEESPGQKSPEKMREFFQAVHGGREET